MEMKSQKPRLSKTFYTCKLKVSVINDDRLYIPISKDSIRLRITRNGKNFKNYQKVKYGTTNNHLIIIHAEKGCDFIVRYDVSEFPSEIKDDPKLFMSNNERYVKWEDDGLVTKFANKHKSLSMEDYVLAVADYIKNEVEYKGFSTGGVADKYEFVDEIIIKKRLVDCIGFHGLFVAFLRAKGIPALLDVGFRLGSGDSPHVWAWYFDKDWKRIDLLDETKIVFGNNSNFPRVSVSLGTTHDFREIIGEEYIVSYVQYILSEQFLRTGNPNVLALFDSYERKSSNIALFRKLVNGIFCYGDFLYILQQEDYLNKRYFKILPRFMFRRNIQRRDTLKRTGRVLFIQTISIALQILFLLIFFFGVYMSTVSYLLSLLWTVFLIPYVLFSIPIFIVLANIVSFPLYSFFRKTAILKATKKVAKMKELKIVMIAGSYGKTSVKNFLTQLLSSNYRVQMTAGNINTHTGIASWINSSLLENTQLLICEVDGFHEGEISGIANMIPPEISVITYLGDQHLERLSSKNTLAKTLLETVTFSKKLAQIVTSPSTYEEIKKHGIDIKAYLNDRKLVLAENMPSLNKFSSTNQKNVALAIAVAKIFYVPPDILEHSVSNLVLPDRRQKLITLNGFEIVDDSYNISFNTGSEGLARAKEIAAKTGKKLLVIFAGIPEVGKENLDANIEYAKKLTSNADFVILLNSVFRKEIERIFVEKKFGNYKVVSTMVDAVTFYERIFKPNDYVILKQPELTDLYY